MQLTLLLILLGSAGAGAGEPPRRPLLKNPALVNIGYVCRWERRCMRTQEQAMNRAVKYVRKYQPPSWKVSLCTLNAARPRKRVDWIGFNNCIQNPRLRQPVASPRR
jgi:hypothetical protein